MIHALSWSILPQSPILPMTQSPQLTPLDEAHAPFFVGIDVGGTGIKFGLVDDLGQTLAWRRIPTRVGDGPAAALERIALAVQEVIDDAGLQGMDIEAIGLGAPGTMDIPAGMLLQPVNLPGWDNFAIRDRVAEATGKQVAFVNDANAAAYGEYWIGSGAAYQSMVLLTLGTGVGGGIIIGDLNIEGQHSHGSEVGHIIINYRDDARTCGDWGGRGHLEAYASATAVVRRAQEALDAGAQTSVRTKLEGGGVLSPVLLAEEAQQGDAFSLDIILETAMYLGVGITSVMHTIDPDAVVLGGSMTFGGHGNEIGRRFLQRIKDEIQKRAFPAPAEKTIIDYATLGSFAGYIGAAGAARLMVQDR